MHALRLGNSYSRERRSVWFHVRRSCCAKSWAVAVEKGRAVRAEDVVASVASAERLASRPHCLV